MKRVTMLFVPVMVVLGAGLATAAPASASAAATTARSPAADSAVTDWVPATFYQPASATGWYTEKGEHPGTGGAASNYLAGINPSYGLRYRDFFVFDLSGIAPAVCAATLQAGNLFGGPPGGTYSLHAVATPVAQLTAGHSAGSADGVAIYTDLGDGTPYGSVALSDSQVTENPISVPFGSGGVTAVNAALGTGSLALGGNFASSGYIFGSTPYGSQQLVLETCVGLAGAREQLAALRLVLRSTGPGASLSAKVARAHAEIAAGHIRAARNTITAFIHEVRAQAGKSIKPDIARQLITIAGRVVALLGG